MELYQVYTNIVSLHMKICFSSYENIYFLMLETICASIISMYDFIPCFTLFESLCSFFSFTEVYPTTNFFVFLSLWIHSFWFYNLELLFIIWPDHLKACLFTGHPLYYSILIQHPYFLGCLSIYYAGLLTYFHVSSRIFSSHVYVSKRQKHAHLYSWFCLFWQILHFITYNHFPNPIYTS